MTRTEIIALFSGAAATALVGIPGFLLYEKQNRNETQQFQVTARNMSETFSFDLQPTEREFYVVKSDDIFIKGLSEHPVVIDSINFYYFGNFNSITWAETGKPVDFPLTIEPFKPVHLKIEQRRYLSFLRNQALNFIYKTSIQQLENDLKSKGFSFYGNSLEPTSQYYNCRDTQD